MNNDLHTLLSANSDPLLPGFCAVEDALQKISQDGGQARGAVFTRREVVEFILNLVGYTVDQPLYQRSILEPSFGKGDFLLVAVERLFESWKRHNRPVSVLNFASCVRAVELHHDTFKSTRNKLINQLKTEGVSDIDINTLTNQWLVHGDFLLSELPAEFEFVVGNPPYVRQELIPDILIAKYRSIYTTIFDRSDLYIPFIERSVRQISSKGKVGIICANRWTKNRYGGPLRQLLSEKYHLHI
ncbi:MAG: N-6 DNA methylase [Bryobacterales bacterium]|nr:N-6 DNA methylase [Bryobacterales bacterium]